MPRIGAGRITAPPRGGLVAALALFAAAAVGCGSTVDSVGYNGPAGIKLKKLTPRSDFPNAFRDRLGHTDAEIAKKLDVAFNLLFHGDLMTEAIYVPQGPNQALIKDVYHGDDVRTEGLGWAMMIAVQLDKRDEFDRLWTYSKATLLFKDPPNKGYFNSSCDTDVSPAPCIDPFGMEQYLMALLFAHDRWSGTPRNGGASADGGAPADASMPGDGGGPTDGGIYSDGGVAGDGGTPTPGGTAPEIDYGADAIALLDVMRHQEDANGGIVEHVTNVFDAVTGLPFDVPSDTRAGRTRPSIVMPAYYELWAQATGDSFWSRAAASGRALLKSSAHPKTGLTPLRCTFDGDPDAPSDSFQSESYRTQINIVLDDIWSGRDPWMAEVSTRLLAFFSSKGFNNYGRAFSLPGNTLDPMREWALIAVNGATALVATNDDRDAYVETVWDMLPPSQRPRYYQGLLYLNALLLLSGNYRIW